MRTLLYIVGAILFLAIVGNMEQADHEKEQNRKEQTRADTFKEMLEILENKHDKGKESR